MVFGFEEYFMEINNIYDMISVCFGLLKDNINNHQVFIGEYVSEGEEGQKNPNLGVLNCFAEKVMAIMRKYEPSGFIEVRDEILEEAKKLQISDFQDELWNRLTVVYHILSAIDAEAMHWDVGRMHRTLGPLDRQRKTPYRVYFSPKETIHKGFVENVGRERTGSSNFFEHFNCFRFVDERKWKENCEVPQVYYTSVSKEQKEEFLEKSKLKIAVLPVSSERNFDFVSKLGASLRVDYFAIQQEAEANQICQCVVKAIEEGAHIIILPEYIASPKISEKIKCSLREMNRRMQGKENLLLVFAGSTWTEEDNNVMQILDARGMVLGEYYKYSAFTQRSSDGHGFTVHEALSCPGKCCDVVGVEGIGLILPAICRDVIDGEYTEELVKMLLPVLVAIAAWSPSVASFKPRLEELANKYFASAVLCNACSAVDTEKENIGLASIVTKKKTIVGCDKVVIKREQCIGRCGAVPCIYFLEYDFGYENSKKRPQLTSYKYCER